ncbi:MAG: hypothetical protein JOY53_18840 [Acidobacteriaceae bacterium]|nr:hypothetical protein [Acidobacteriaceae bacterium]
MFQHSGDVALGGSLGAVDLVYTVLGVDDVPQEPRHDVAVWRELFYELPAFADDGAVVVDRALGGVRALLARVASLVLYELNPRWSGIRSVSWRCFDLSRPLWTSGKPGSPIPRVVRV